MEKNTGIHFYINIKNLMDIIKQESIKDDDLKRTLHRLNTYFIGFSKLINQYGGTVEKYTGGRAHVIIEHKEDSVINDNTIEALVACYVYVNNIFNKLGKYSQYTMFDISGGIDFGDYYDHYIIDGAGNQEYTSIGSVANNSAKIQSFALKNYIYATGKFVDKLPQELKEKFTELTDEEINRLEGKLKIKRVYKAKYTSIYSEEKLSEIEYRLSLVKEKVTSEANGLKLSDIDFQGVSKQLAFDNLSLKGINKKIEQGYVLCADIRGFTKLFNNSDNNLDDLKDVMESIYEIMKSTVEESKATKVQYQGDRVVAVYNDFNGEEDAVLRMIKAAFTLNYKIQELNRNEEVKEKLKSKTIAVGIGCGAGKIIATRLGMKGNKDNIVLSEAYESADKAEDRYAEKNEISIYKDVIEIIEAKDENSTETLEYAVLLELFVAKSTTGYHVSNASIEDFNNKLSEKQDKQKNIDNSFINTHVESYNGLRATTELMPWGIK